MTDEMQVTQGNQNLEGKNGNGEITRNDTVRMRCDEDYPSSAGFRVI